MSSLDNATANALSNSFFRFYEQLSLYTVTTVATVKNNTYVQHVYKNLTISCKLGLATVYSIVHAVFPFWCEVNPYVEGGAMRVTMKEDAATPVIDEKKAA